VPTDHAHDPGLVFREERHDRLGRYRGDEPAEAAEVDEQDGRLAQLGSARVQLEALVADAARHLGCEEAREIGCRPLLGGGADEKPAAALKREREDRARREDREELVDLGADQDGVGHRLDRKAPGHSDGRVLGARPGREDHPAERAEPCGEK